MEEQRSQLLSELWEAQNQAYALMSEYDSLPHHYGDNILYQAEGHIIDLIAMHPGITITALAGILKKTTSACSQLVRKLKNKGWVSQSRNPDNNRLYNLTLTDSGMSIFQDHQRFVQECQEATFRLLKDFTEEELKQHIKIQEQLNLAYRGDVQRSRENFNSRS